MNKQPSIFKWLVMVLVATLLAQPVFTPPPVSAAPPQDSTKFSTSFQTKSSLLQTPDILIQCVGSLSACSDLTPNTTVTEYVDFTNDDRRIEFKILCQGWNCTNRDIYYSVTMDVEWGNGIDAPWFHEYATLGTTPGGSGGLVTMPCGTGLSGSCSLSTSGVISADDINPDPNSSWHFGITNTGGTSASGEWHHRVLNIQVSLDPAIDCSPDSFEPDDTLATGSPITLGEVQRHTLCPQGDEDWVTFHSNVTLPGARNFLVETFDLEPDDINPNGNTIPINHDCLTEVDRISAFWAQNLLGNQR